MKIRILYTFVSLLILSNIHPIRCAELGVLGRIDTITTELNDLAKVQKAVYGYTDKKLSSITLYEAASINSTWSPIQKLLISELNGVRSTIVQKYISNANSFVNSTKTELLLDDKSNPMMEAAYVWDDENSTWKGFRTKLERTYIDSGVINSYSYSDWDSIASSWKIYTQGTINYTPFKKPNELLNSSLDNNNQLVASSKILISYNANNDPEYETTYSYSGGYLPILRTHYEYSESSPQYKETVETYNQSSATWKASQKTEQTYVDGQLVKYLVADFDSTTLVWKERFKHEFSLLSSSIDSMNIVQTDNPNGVTQLSKKYKSVTDGNGLNKMTNTVEKNGTTISNQISQLNIIGGSLDQYTNSDELENIKMVWNFDAKNDKLQCLYYRQNGTAGQLDLLRTSTLSFSTKNVAIPAVLAGEITFGPNPFSSSLKISNSTASALSYKVLTLEGKIVCAGKSANKEIYIQTQQLQTGAYILQLSIGKLNQNSVIIRK